jgi:hypothetical protein
MRAGCSPPTLLSIFLLSFLPTVTVGEDRAEPIDIGGRQMFLQFSGAGSPAVVLISGKGNGAEDWSEILDPADPAHTADYDAVAGGARVIYARATRRSIPRWRASPASAPTTGPDVRLAGSDRSTPVARPHPADQAAPADRA